MKKAVVALGGNAIIQPGEKGNIHQQFANTRANLDGIVDLIKEGYSIAVTHGNGPQVGNLLLAVEAIRTKVDPLPLGVLVGATQGTMGYMIAQSLKNRLDKEGIKKEVTTVVTQVEVDKNDPAIENPSKPVGPFYSVEDARILISDSGWKMVEDAGRGWRRVVPSPIPVNVVEKNTIKNMLDNGNIVITCGGGGIPVYKEEDQSLEGLDAVIDKDYASEVLAEQIGAEVLIISTGVDNAALNFGKENEKKLEHLTIKEAEKYLEEGQFPKGSMGPKIKAAVKFIESGGKEVIITSPNKIAEAIKGNAGTHVTK